MRFDRKPVRTAIPVIDRQHDQYFDAVEYLFDMYERAEVIPDKVLGILNNIQEYAQDNFDTEERFMENEGYPGLDHHRAKHDTFKSSIDGFMEDFANTSNLAKIIEDLRQLLVSWFVDQIKTDDMALAEFLKKKGYGSRS